jgi:hypothetical protein
MAKETTFIFDGNKYTVIDRLAQKGEKILLANYHQATVDEVINGPLGAQYLIKNKGLVEGVYAQAALVIKSIESGYDEKWIVGNVNILMNNDNKKDKKTVLYFVVNEEKLIENLEHRRNRPVQAWKRLIPEVLTKLGYDQNLSAKFRWSQKAGCSCGCSPGFIFTGNELFAKSILASVSNTINVPNE